MSRLTITPSRPTLAEQKVRAMGGAPNSAAYGWRSASDALDAARQELEDARQQVDNVALPGGPWQNTQGR